MGDAETESRSITPAELLIQNAEISESTIWPQSAVVSYVHAFCLLCDSIEFLSTDEQARLLSESWLGWLPIAAE